MDKSNSANLLDLLIVLARNKRLIISNVLIITFLSLIISLVWPKTYLSTSEIIQTRENIGNLGGLLQSLGSIGSNQSKVGGETILVILNSESLQRKIIEEFNLSEVYGTEIQEELQKKLKDHVSITEIREGGFGFNPIVSVEIAVEDESPERAKKMNEFILEELKKKMRELNSETSKENLLIMENRLAKNERELKTAESKLNEFQNKYGIFEAGSQLEALITNLAEIKSRIIAREVELSILMNQLNNESAEIKKLEQEIRALSVKYDQLLKESENIEQNNDVFYPLFEMPDLLLTYSRLLREVEIQNKVYELLLPQVEQQRMFLENDGSGLRVIDFPELPTYKHKPKRAYIVIGGFLFSVFISLFLVFIREMLQNQDSETGEKLNHLLTELSFKRK